MIFFGVALNIQKLHVIYHYKKYGYFSLVRYYEKMFHMQLRIKSDFCPVVQECNILNVQFEKSLKFYYKLNRIFRLKKLVECHICTFKK